MFVDPNVCRAKFQRELDEFKAQRDAYHRRGVWLLDDTFPEIFLALAAVKMRPMYVAFGVVINFENYDVEPPSIRFVNPATREPMKAGELSHGMPRVVRAKAPNGQPATGPNGEPEFEMLNLIQAEDAQRPGFVCLQGVREYHEHPAHTGDSWLLHRGTGKGRLAHLVTALSTYGLDTIVGLKLNVVGLNVSPRPE